MDYIKYKTTLKASGDEYKKIVFWNRFVRNPVETILTWTPAAITIVLIVLGFLNRTWQLYMRHAGHTRFIYFSSSSKAVLIIT